MFGTIGPVLIILVIEFINANNDSAVSSTRFTRQTTFLISVMHALSLFFLGVGINLLLTEIGKKWIGRLRPNFIQTCNPDLASISCFMPNSTIYRFIDTNADFCKGDSDMVKEARLSFPSGHSSFSCYAMGFLILYIEVRLVVFRLRFIKPLVQMTALIAAYVTCISRLGDYKHRGSDVVGGALLGLIVAVSVAFGSGRVLWNFTRHENQRQSQTNIRSNSTDPDSDRNQLLTV
jgi:phosphatidate phosphatase